MVERVRIFTFFDFKIEIIYPRPHIRFSNCPVLIEWILVVNMKVDSVHRSTTGCMKFMTKVLFLFRNHSMVYRFNSYNLLLYIYMYCPEIVCVSEWVGYLKVLFFTPPPQHEQSSTSTYWYTFVCTAKWVWFRVTRTFDGIGFYPAEIACFNSTYWHLQRSVYDSEWVRSGEVHTWFCLLVHIYMNCQESVIPSEWAVWRYWLFTPPPSTNTAHWRDRFVLKSIVLPKTAFTQNHFPIIPLDAVLVVRVVGRRWLIPPQHGINLLDFLSHHFDLCVHPSASTVHA